jgi:hypothetical protein
MRRRGLLVLAFALAAAIQARSQEATKDVLKPGKDLPGPFTPYNVTGPAKGKFHCLVSDYGAEPVVMLVARGLEDDKAFRELLTQLDGAIERNPLLRLHAFVVFVRNDLADPSLMDDKRQEVEKQVRNLADALKLKHVVLTLGGKADLEKYKLDDGAALTALLYRKLRIEASHAVGRGQVKDAAGKVVEEVKSKLGAKK